MRNNNGDSNTSRRKWTLKRGVVVSHLKGAVQATSVEHLESIKSDYIRVNQKRKGKKG